jgi:hypothetical protein
MNARWASVRQPLLFIPLQLPLAPMRLFAIGLELPNPVAVQRLQHADACYQRITAPAAQHYTLYLEHEPMIATPQPVDEAITEARFVCPTAENFDAANHGVRLMDAQHRTYSDKIGKFVQLARVTAKGVSSGVIHRWAALQQMQVCPGSYVNEQWANGLVFA